MILGYKKLLVSVEDQEFVDYYRDEELGAIGVLASVGHRQPAGSIVLQFEVLVSKPGGKKLRNCG